MKNILTTTLILTALFVNSCGSGGGDGGPGRMDLPYWYLTNEVKEGYIFDTATEKSPDLQMAVDMAETKAMANMAKKMEAKIGSATSRMQEQFRDGADVQMTDTFSNTMEALVKTTLRGVRQSNKHIVQENGEFRAYVQISYNAADAAQQIMDELKKNQMIQKRKEHKQELADMRSVLDEAFKD